MSIICAICHDNFISTDNISYIRCGHVFHFKCLSEWFNGSNSCPHCRQEISQKKSRKLYVTFSSNETDTNINSLQQKIDNLKFKILLNEKNMSHFISKNETLQRQNAGLRQEVRKVESEINNKNSMIYNLKEELRCIKEKSEDLKQVKLQISRQEKELEKLREQVPEEKYMNEQLFNQFKKWVNERCMEINARQTSRLQIQQIFKSCSIRNQELKELFDTIAQYDHMDSDSQTKLNKSPFSNTLKRKNNTGQEIGSRNNSTFKRQRSRTETETINIDDIKSPVLRKAKNFLRTHRNNDETNNMDAVANCWENTN